MKRKPILGERLFVLNVGNAARNTKQTLRPVIVSKVGRKYFAVESEDRWKTQWEFHIGDWREVTKYTPDAELYETEQQLSDERELLELARLIRNEFTHAWGTPKQSLETLRKIYELIKTETK